MNSVEGYPNKIFYINFKKIKLYVFKQSINNKIMKNIASDSSDENDKLIVGDEEEEDSFELQRINEEDEFYLDDYKINN